MSWKDHPVVVAGITAAATLAFSTTVVLPIWTKVQDNRIEEYQQSEKALKERVEIAERDSAALSKINKKMTMEGVLRINDRYPKGARELRVGDSIERISTVYPQAELDEGERWYSVKVKDNAIFDEITYYFSKQTKKITHVMFFFSDRVSRKKGAPIVASSSQLAMVDQLRYAFPDAEINEGVEDREVVYSAKISGKAIFEVTPQTFGIY